MCRRESDESNAGGHSENRFHLLADKDEDKDDDDEDDGDEEYVDVEDDNMWQ